MGLLSSSSTFFECFINLQSKTDKRRSVSNASCLGKAEGHVQELFVSFHLNVHTPGQGFIYTDKT